MDYFEASFKAALALLIKGDPEIYQIVGTSLKISVTAVFCSALLAVPLGVVVGICEFPGKALLRQLLGTLMAVPTVVVGLLLYGFLSRRGVLGGWELLYTPAAVVIGESVLIFPLLLHLVATSVMSGDPRLVPTLESLGANAWQRFVMLLSEARVSVGAALVTAFGRAIGEIGVAMLLGGNVKGLTRTMTTAIALETSKGEFELGLALGLVLLAVAFIVNGLLGWLQSIK